MMQSPAPPSPDAGKLQIAGYPVTQKRYALADREFRMLVPADPETILDQTVEIDAHVADQFLPYWSEVWPAAIVLAEWILLEPERLTSPVLELGCGLGLVGLAAMAVGRHVTFSDYATDALTFAVANAERNGLSGYDTLLMDWRRPVDRKYGTILGADLLYERRWHEPLLEVFAGMLSCGGEAMIADPNRRWTGAFLSKCQQAGWQAEPIPSDRLGSQGRRRRVTIYRIRRSGLSG